MILTSTMGLFCFCIVIIKKAEKDPMAKQGNKKWIKGMAAPPGAGRPKGRKNKLSGDVVANILDTARQLEEQGMSLIDRAELDPDWYYENFYKPLVPKNINLAGDLGISVEIFIGPKKVN